MGARIKGRVERSRPGLRLQDPLLSSPDLTPTGSKHWPPQTLKQPDEGTLQSREKGWEENQWLQTEEARKNRIHCYSILAPCLALCTDYPI